MIYHDTYTKYALYIVITVVAVKVNPCAFMQCCCCLLDTCRSCCLFLFSSNLPNSSTIQCAVLMLATLDVAQVHFASTIRCTM